MGPRLRLLGPTLRPFPVIQERHETPRATVAGLGAQAPSDPANYPLGMDQQPELRRAFFRGYRRADVELALARATISRERVQLELEAMRARAEDLLREVEDLRSQIGDHRHRESELLAALDEVRDRRESLEREARLKAEEIIAEARERAAARRTDGLKEVSELQEQVEQLLGLRSGLMATLKQTMEEVGGVLDHLAGTAPRPPVHEQAGEHETRHVPEPHFDAEHEHEPEHVQDLDTALTRFSGESER